MMKAVAYQQSLTIDQSDALQDVELERPSIGDKDLFVNVKAISVNPVDTKVRMRAQPNEGEWKVLGWDAVGTVAACGENTEGFNKGDRVWYAGDLTRQGSNAEYQAVDHRLVAKAPASLNDTDAAALPLTSLTAWELLFDRFGITSESTGTLLIIGAAGGVGSMVVQLAKQLTQLTVVATASRPESIDWVKYMGADHVINHHESLADQLAELKLQPSFVASLTATEQHQAAIAEVIAPQGKLGLIDDPMEFDIRLFKQKSIAIHWEFMYTRSLFTTDDIAKQGEILQQVAALVDSGKIKTTATNMVGKLNAENMRLAHQQLESGSTIGKWVLEGF